MSFSALITSLKYVHGSYNTFVILLFLFQGWLGLMIRKDRKAGRPLKAKTIRRHRNNGPLVAFMGILGFCAGVTTVLLEYGHLWLYPLHFIIGSLIALLIVTTFLISKKIKGCESLWRTPHFIIGVSIICLYFSQAFLGLYILFFK